MPRPKIPRKIVFAEALKQAFIIRNIYFERELPQARKWVDEFARKHDPGIPSRKATSVLEKELENCFRQGMQEQRKAHAIIASLYARGFPGIVVKALFNLGRFKQAGEIEESLKHFENAAMLYKLARDEENVLRVRKAMQKSEKRFGKEQEKKLKEFEKNAF